METPPSGRYSVQSPSKKRVFPRGSSGSKLLKQKEGSGSEALDADSNKDSGDVIIVDAKANVNQKEKEAFSSSADKQKSSESESYDDDLPYSDGYDMATTNDGLIVDKDEALQSYLDSKGIAPGEEAPIPWFLVPSHSKKPQSNAKSSNSSSSTSKFDNKKLHPIQFKYPNPQLGTSSFYSYPFPIRPPVPPPFVYGSYALPPPVPFMAQPFMPLSPPPMPPMPPVPASLGVPMPMWFSSSFHGSPFGSPLMSTAGGAASPFSHGPFWGYQFPGDSVVGQSNEIGDGSSVAAKVDEKDVVDKFQNFKQFDTVEDFSDHRFQSIGFGDKQPPKTWMKKIQGEWKILEKNLPENIYVRVCESKIDLLRAVIVGAEGTPYHDGLFFFDIHFPSDYPNVPPEVNYHSGGLGINPNMYSCGKVCLSLLNTWPGENRNQQWIPGVSTILQVLVSIQALILNANPFFNEPGYERMSGSPFGEMQSRQYNEKVFALSLRTMMYSIRKPPQHFEDFVMGHFFNRAERVLGACKAYMEGAQVGSLVNGEAQNTPYMEGAQVGSLVNGEAQNTPYMEGAQMGSLVNGEAQNIDPNNKSCSEHLTYNLRIYIPMLVKTFSQMGVKDVDKFLPLADKKDNAQVVPSAPLPFNFT